MKDFYIPENTGETRRALKAKKDFLALGPGRSLDKLLATYQEQKRNSPGSNPPSTNRSTIADWSRRWGWIELSARYDDFIGDRLLEEQKNHLRQQHRETLTQFKDHHLKAGKAGWKASTDALKAIIEFLQEHPKIQSWDECLKAASLIARLESYSELWARAIGVQYLLKDTDPGQHLTPQPLGQVEDAD
jgi:hypothetical protein